MKSKLLEIEKSSEDEVCSRTLIFLHKTIDENFPNAPKVASKRFSQTVVANYDKINLDEDTKLNLDNNNLVKEVKEDLVLKNETSKDEGFEDMFGTNDSIHDTKDNDTSDSVFGSNKTKDNDRVDSIFGSNDTSEVEKESSQYSNAFESKRGFQDFAESEFNSKSSKIFSDRYLNKVARRSKRGIIYRFVRFVFIVVVLSVAVIFITGKQDKFMTMIKDFPSFYETYLRPKLEEFKSYFKSNENQEDDILDLLNNKK